MPTAGQEQVQPAAQLPTWELALLNQTISLGSTETTHSLLEAITPPVAGARYPISGREHVPSVV